MKRFEMSDQSTIYRYSIIDNVEKGVLKVNECVVLLNKLNDENEQLRFQLKNTSVQRDEFLFGARKNAERIEELRQALKDTEEEKEHYADLYNECRRLKLSDEAIKQAYTDLNRREREKHSQGNATYTATINQNEVIY